MNTKNSHLVYLELKSDTLIIYHSLLNEPQLLEFDSEADKDEFINAINHGRAKSGIQSLDKILMLTDESARKKMIKRKKKYLQKSNNGVSYFSLMTAESCNLGCSYCIASINMESARKVKSILMNWDIAKKGLDWYFNLPSTANEYYVNFSGGEPLINKSVVIESIEYIRSLKKIKPIKVSINTNAVLIDDYLANFLAKNIVEIATSLDGTPDTSDLVRITRNGLPASRKILNGWERLKKSGCELTGFMATFNDKNINYLDESIIDFAKGMGFSWVRIACDVIHMLDYPVKVAIEKIWNVYKYGTDNDIFVEGFWSTPMNNLLQKNRNPGNTGFFCGAVSGETISLHPDGRLSACGFSSGNFGNILHNKPFNFHSHKGFIDEYYPGSRDFCKGCEIEGSCAGGCNITREVSISEKDESSIKYNCEMYREFTKRMLLDHFERNYSNFGPYFF